MPARRGKTTLIFASFVCLTACGDAPETSDPIAAASIAAASQPIINGVFDPGDPAVVALVANQLLLCTATLIRPTVVVTAAHCTPPHIGQFGVTSYTQIQIFFGNNVYEPGQLRNVVEGWTHPGWDSESIADDIALLRLDSPAPVAPLPFNTDPVTLADVGQDLRIIGFGQTSAADPQSTGLKYQGDSTVEEVYPSVLTMPLDPGITCNGDSGGTTLWERGGQEILVGVHSRSDCETGALDTRVDAYSDEIYTFLGESPTGPGCGQDGQCTTTCGFVDVDCPCAGDGFCTNACLDPATDPDCNPGCAGDGLCHLEGCNMPDPDCIAGCGVDGICDATCSFDADCEGDAGKNWTAGGLEPEEYDAYDAGGCALAPGSDRPGNDRESAALLIGLLLLVVARRRRADENP